MGEQDSAGRPFPWWIVSVVAALAVLALLVTHRPASTTTVSSVSARTAAAHSRPVHKSVAARAAHTPLKATAIATRPGKVRPYGAGVRSLPGRRTRAAGAAATATAATGTPAASAPATGTPATGTPATVAPTAVAPTTVAPTAVVPRELPHTD